MSTEEAHDECAPQSTPEPCAEDYEAVRQALEDLRAGDTGIPFEEFDRQFRAEHNVLNDGAP